MQIYILSINFRLASLKAITSGSSTVGSPSPGQKVREKKENTFVNLNLLGQRGLGREVDPKSDKCRFPAVSQSKIWSFSSSRGRQGKASKSQTTVDFIKM